MRFQFLTIALFVACADARRAPPAPKHIVAPFGVIQPMDPPKEQDLKKVKQVKLGTCIDWECVLNFWERLPRRLSFE